MKHKSLKNCWVSFGAAAPLLAAACNYSSSGSCPFSLGFNLQSKITWRAFCHMTAMRELILGWIRSWCFQSLSGMRCCRRTQAGGSGWPARGWTVCGSCLPSPPLVSSVSFSKTGEKAADYFWKKNKWNSRFGDKVI